MKRILITALVCLLLMGAVSSLQIQPASSRVWNAIYTPKDEMINQWKTLCDAHPNIASYEIIGQSIQKRNIYLFAIGNPQGGKVMYDGQLHGWEDGGTEVLYKFAQWLLTSSDPQAQSMLQNNYNLFIPVVNVDSTNRQNMRREYVLDDGTVIAVPYGVDLNRNAVYGWDSSGSSDPTNDYEYRGLFAGSEPEIQAIRFALDRYRPQIYLNTHLGSSYMIHRSDTAFEDQIKQLITYYSGQQGVTPYPMDPGIGGGLIATDADESFGASGWLIEIEYSDKMPNTLQEFLTIYYPKLFPIFLAFNQVTSGAELETSFGDNFESGSFSQWSGTAKSRGETSSLSNTFLFEDSYSARFTSNGGGGYETAHAYKNIYASSELYAKGYFNFAQSGIVEVNDRFFTIIFSSGSNNLAYAGIRETTQGTKWCLTTRDGSGYIDIFSDAVVSNTEGWLNIELHWKKDSTNGLAEMWVDGTKVCEATGLNTAYFGDATRLKTGLAEAYSCTPTTIYADNIQLSTNPFQQEPTTPKTTLFTASPTLFSPNNDQTQLTATFNMEIAWILQIKSSSGSTICTYTDIGNSLLQAWDGKDSAGNTVPDGLYTAALWGSDSIGTPLPPTTVTVAVDSTLPTVSSIYASPTTVKPGKTVKFSYTLAENCQVTAQLYNDADVLVKTLLEDVFQSSGIYTVSWNGKLASGARAPTGDYTFKLSVADLAGNYATYIAQAIVTIE